ncbi:hypothetical protein E0493_08855 [Roseomonas sp. M0104]|uniref:OmpA-like domain-containing protein n=1 Tax=Teichococcus coralli TaxID=2545983 RepID=A0A845BDM6_9PROT|nr:hypothetical protein [Pseudoroseomonas coralli]MXP63457.1 hypothetical protein [Pseudoroseomonas coralli]
MRAFNLPFLPPLRRSVPLLALLALAATAHAQLPDGRLPSDPAAAAPRAPDLTRPPRPAPAMPQPGFNLPRGIEAMPGGGWRLTGSLARGTLDGAPHSTLAEIAHWLSSRTTGRVTLVAQVANPENDVSLARRDSLAHALAIRHVLEQAGLDGTRIDIRPLGRTAEARDAIELLPPPARSDTPASENLSRP